MLKQFAQRFLPSKMYARISKILQHLHAKHVAIPMELENNGDEEQKEVYIAVQDEEQVVQQYMDQDGTIAHAFFEALPNGTFVRVWPPTTML